MAGDDSTKAGAVSASAGTVVLDGADALAATHTAEQIAAGSSLVGTTLAGRYQVRKRLGEGGMGTVFMAEQTHSVQRKVAL